MKKTISIILSIALAFCLFIIPTKANEIDTPPDDPIGPDEYTELYVTSTTYGTSTWYYVTDARIKVRPRITSGILRVSGSNVYSYSVGEYADIMGFESDVYTTSQAHASLTNVVYSYSSGVVTVKFNVHVWVGSVTNSTTSGQITLTLPYQIY